MSLRDLGRDLQELAGVPEPATDAALVEQLEHGADPAAFESLVRRHGPMVLGVCRRVLGHTPDAEDAFQATFLVLARDLRKIRRTHSLAAWLHGVARRVSLTALQRRAALRRHDRAAARPEAVSAEDLSWKEIRTVLDEELARLPERWRLPLVLCYLEGRTQDEAARQLGWGKSNLRRRLNEARDALGRRLARRGIGGAALAAWLVSDAVAGAAVPPALATTTVSSGLAAVSGNGRSVPAAAGELCQKVSTTMNPIRHILFVLALCAVVAAGYATLKPRGAPEPIAARRAAPVPLPTPAPAGAADAGRLMGNIGVPLCKTQIAISPDGKRIAVCGTVAINDNVDRNARLKVYEVDLNTPALTLEQLTQATDWIAQLDSPDARTVQKAVTGLERIGPAARSILLKTLRGRCSDELKAGIIAALEKLDPVIREGIDVEFTEKTAMSVALSPDGKTVAVGMGDAPVTYLVDVATGKIRDSLALGDKDFWSNDGRLAFDAQGKSLVASYPAAGTVYVWDLATKKKRQLPKPKEAGYWGLAVRPDGKHVALGESNGTVTIWDAVTGEEVGGHELHKGSGNLSPANTCRYSPDGRMLLTWGADGTIRVYDLKEQREVAVHRTTRISTQKEKREPPGNRIAKPTRDWADFTADGKLVVTGGSTDEGEEAIVWDPKTDKVLTRFLTIRSDEERYESSTALSPDGSIVVTIDRTSRTNEGDASLRLWSTGLGKR
jgi:RNA polymerase sigma factor (sigma-70 family)